MTKRLDDSVDMSLGGPGKGQPRIDEERVQAMRVARDPRVFLAVDPGDKHVGVACWSRASGMRSLEKDANKALALLDRLLPGKSTLVLERFVLYPARSAAQSWSPMATAEMIGAIKWIAAQHAVPVTLQGADIKEPTRRQCIARNLEFKKRSPHASDAALHLWHFLLRNEIVDSAERI